MIPLGFLGVLAVIGLKKLNEKVDDRTVRDRDNALDSRKKETKRNEIYRTWDDEKFKNFRICTECWEEINRLSSKCKFCQSAQNYEFNVNRTKTYPKPADINSDLKINCPKCQTVVTVAISGNKCWKCGHLI